MPLREEMISQGNFLFKYRSFLPILILLAGLYVYVRHKLFSPNDDEFTWELICLSVCLVGLFIRIYCIGYSHDNTSGRNTEEGQIAEAINQSGLYATCRHPLYLGNFLMWLGIALLTLNGWFVIAFIFLFWVYYERIMFAEEEYLRNKFGKVYTDWAEKTPAFIPDLTKWTPPRLSFSWKKVIRQEKAGILNLFLVFWLFKAIAAYSINGTILIENTFWQFGLLAAIAWYILIKGLQMTTVLFEKDR
ncbi:MAG: isoprenylcysteine carboxylmethyltransferase family protein [Saprospiraceae bacterium]